MLYICGDYSTRISDEVFYLWAIGFDLFILTFYGKLETVCFLLRKFGN